MDVDTDTPAAFLSRDIVPGDVLKMVNQEKKWRIHGQDLIYANEIH